MGYLNGALRSTVSHAQSGGAIYATIGSNLSLESSVSNSNKATWGGAIMISGSSSVSILQG